MSIGREGDITDDLVLRTWQVVTLLGDARECSDEFEQPELTCILAKVEMALLAIVSEMAKSVSGSKRQRRPKRAFGNAAHNKLCPRVSGWRDCPTPSPPSSPAEGVASALTVPRYSPRASLRCAPAASLAQATIENISSSIRFHEATTSDSETAVGTPASPLASPKVDGLSRSAMIDYSNAAGIS